MSQATPLEAPANRVDRRVQAFRAHVLACAEALFAERGIEGTKIDDVCEAADVAKRTLCNHFPTKSHLVEALAHDAVSRLVTTVDEARESGDSTRARLEAHGAIMDPPRDPRRCDGVDPEGNVFQIAAPDP